MDPGELIRAAPGLAKGTAALAAAVPFTAIVKRMLGPAADEVAELLRDRVRVYRYERQVRLLEKVEKIAHEAGFTPQPVPPKILFPLLEGASFEEDETVHDMWANLLANAAASKNADVVRPSYIATLKQLAPDEALLFKWFSERRNETELTFAEGLEHYKSLQLPTHFDDPDYGAIEGFTQSMSTLALLQLVHESWTGDDLASIIYTLTMRGTNFALACQTPHP